ncbi:TIGR03084 family metal-binding protein [Dermatobacter hominis]|uniref:TIGR03084 family metal-binding protein n=1 Tax=Dermatobacter hominis TaxID=2884263 RepID=UPI001D0F9120|nr:TIGR03084 family metal-binding protein [Dermatobacter hominis]UDY37020.1 TIGR03084 family protein [Dermatobacter hominis]
MSGPADLLDDLRRDLLDEVAALAAVVDPLEVPALSLPTPAEGWDVGDQLSHLAAFDEHAVMAITDPQRFSVQFDLALAGGDDPIVAATERGRLLGPEESREWWHRAAEELEVAAAGLRPGERVPWFGPDMGAVSFLTARLMETWAHGQDVRDAVGAPPEVSPRLRHVADLGVRARPYSYRVRGMAVPDAPLRVELDAPDGTVWSWGPEGAADTVRGDAVELCLLVTQRRHRDDVVLEVVGPAAEEWVGIAQAFAGGPGPGRAPLA